MFTCKDCGGEAIPTGFGPKTYCKDECDLKPKAIESKFFPGNDSQIFWTWANKPTKPRVIHDKILIMVNKDDELPSGARREMLAPVKLKGRFKVYTPAGMVSSVGDAIGIEPDKVGIEMVWV